MFKDVCAAIQHAHMKGVIHRDLKPSNIMITLHDAKPVVKVIDLGIAKATEQKLTEKTLFTSYGQMIGTPAYMSPEQAVMSGLDVDTRSDVYSLGVLLYELLTGGPPFNAKTLRTAGYDEMRRIIREEQPPKPSARLQTLDKDEKLTIAGKRHASPQALGKQLNGDLDWIIMKALEKDRSRRYESASAFATDIQRHLDDEPVEAGAPSMGYKLRRFARRNKGPVTIAAVIAFMLLAGTVVSSWQAVRATQAEALAITETTRAIKAEKQALAAAERAAAAAASEKAANVQALKRLAQIEKGNEIITSIFTDLDITEVKEGTEPLEAVLAKRLVKAADQLVGESVGDPVAVAVLQNHLGSSLDSLGYPEDAIKLLLQARDTFTALLWEDDLDTLSTMNNLALAYKTAGQLDRAAPLHEQTLKLRKAKLGDDHPSTLGTMNNLALAYKTAGQLDLALPLFKEGVAAARRKHPKASASLASALAFMGLILLERETFGQAEPLLRECLDIRKKTMPDHWLLFNTHSMLGGALLGQKQYTEAEPLLLAGYEGMKQREDAIVNQGKIRVIESLEWLVTLYEQRNAEGDADNAAKYRKLLEAAS